MINMRYLIVLECLLLLGSIGCRYDVTDGVYYNIEFLHVDISALPKKALVIRTNGNTIWEERVRREGSLYSVAYFPENATMAYVYSGDILVATGELHGRKVDGADNYFSIFAIPDPLIYQPEGKSE